MRHGAVDEARLQAACAAADVHPLLCAVAHKTGDFSLLEEEFAPDQSQLLVPGRGLTDEQESEARARAGSALADHLAAGRPDHTLAPDEWRQIFDLPRRSRVERALGGLPGRGTRARGHRPPSTQLAHGRSRALLQVRRGRSRRLGPGGRAPAAPGRHRRDGVREERRRGRHLAGERVPGLPRRRAEPALQLLLRPDQRLGLAVLGTARPPGLPAVDGQEPGPRRRASASSAK